MPVLQPHSSRNCCGLGCSVFARHYWRNHYCFLFLQLLRCFSSLGLLLYTEILRLHRSGLPHSEICGLIRITDPRSLSQLITSFIASESLGIPHTLLFASCSTKISAHVETMPQQERRILASFYPAFAFTICQRTHLLTGFFMSFDFRASDANNISISCLRRFLNAFRKGSRYFIIYKRLV